VYSIRRNLFEEDRQIETLKEFNTIAWIEDSTMFSVSRLLYSRE